MITLDYIAKSDKIRITCEDSSRRYWDEIREHFSVPNEGAKFSKGGFTPSRKYAITAAGYSLAGMYKEILQYISLNSIPNITITDEFKQLTNSGIKLNAANKFQFQLRDYQKNAVEFLSERGRGIIELGTGAGKTLTCASLIQTYKENLGDNFKCLLIVPNIGLVEQSFDDFKAYGAEFTFSKWSGKNKLDRNVDVIIVNHAILLSQYKENVKWLRDVSMIIADEVHTIKPGNKITKLIQTFNTTKKFGCTGTIPIDKYERWNIVGLFGPQVIKKTSYDLREAGVLATVAAKCLHVTYPTSDKMEYMEELEYLYRSPFRNNLIRKLAATSTKNVLIMVNHTEHGHNILNALAGIDKRCFFINGKTDVDERKRVIALMEAHDDIVVVANSKVFSTGINVKNLHLIVMAAGGKAFTRIVQTIGRSLRKREGKDSAAIVDLCDELKYSQRHYKERKIIYSSEVIPFSDIRIIAT